ncbi:MAG: hypothetical protein NW226_06855 [Microscillaceae bacterium]|nr:hypothetical protein [Microscillaceae bacterium]
MKKITIFCFCLLIFFEVSGQTVIKGIVNGDITDIKVFLPILGFSQSAVTTIVELEEDGSFLLNIPLNVPHTITINFTLGRESRLLLEPGDTIYIQVSPHTAQEHRPEWLKVQGNNALGHTYLNTIYDFVLFDKFAQLRNVFDGYLEADWEIQWDVIQEEFQKQSSWLDSLHENKAITN